jgi:hypothetical protein
MDPVAIPLAREMDGGNGEVVTAVDSLSPSPRGLSGADNSLPASQAESEATDPPTKLQAETKADDSPTPSQARSEVRDSSPTFETTSDEFYDDPDISRNYYQPYFAEQELE